MSGYRSHSQRVGRETFDVDVRYTNFEPIGDGAYGFVCSADDNATGKRVAIKKVKDMFRDLGDAKRILRELKLLRHFRPHENVVTILDIMVYPENSLDFRDVYIVTNLMEIDLQRIISSKQPLTDQHYHYFLYQLLRGLKYIHSANVLHRDLKPSNLVLNANCDLAICDFGLARGVDQEGSETLTEYVQTRWYRAPELLCYSNNYDAAVDMWSVGCIFAELLGGKPFFQGKNPMHQLQVIVDVLGCPSEEDMVSIKDKAARAVILKQARHTGVQRGMGGSRPLAEYFPDTISPHAIDLLSKMLVFNPEKRICVEEALEHPYVGDLHAEMLGKEPVCHSVFDFDFEKNDVLAGVGVGVRSSGSTPRRHRVIPSGELKTLVLEELMAYRPSFEGSTLLFRARQAAVEQRHLQLQAAVGNTSSADMEPQDYEAFLWSAQAALGTLSPMVDASMGPGMTTPTPGVHGYPGAMSYSSAVPARGASHSQHAQQQQQQQHQRRSSNSRQRGLPPQHPSGSSSAKRTASPAAVAAAVAAATAASSAASQAQNGGFPGMGGHGAGGASASHRASMYPGFYVEQAFGDGTLGLQQQQQQQQQHQQFYHQGSWGQTQPGAMETDQQHM